MYVLDQYAPKELSQIFNKTALLAIESWIKTSKKPLLIYGPVGSGKSTLVRLFAEKNNFTLFELNPSDDRSKDNIESSLNAVSNSKSLFGNKNLLFFDDIDVFFGEDRGGFDFILKSAKESSNPVIFCATNIYADKKLSALRDMCDLLEIKPLQKNILYKYIENILEENKIKYEKVALENLIEMNPKDLRALFLDIDFLKPFGIYYKNLDLLFGRERKEDVFKTVIGLFKAKSFQEAKEISDKTEIDFDLLYEWIAENLHLFYEGKNLKDAYNLMSLADINKTRIYSRQNWLFFKYFLVFGIIAPAIYPYKDKFSYKISFPQSIKLRAKESSEFSKNKKVSIILSKVLRGSNSKIASELFLYNFLIKDLDFVNYLKSHLTEDDLKDLESFFKVKLVDKVIEEKELDDKKTSKETKVKNELKREPKKEEKKEEKKDLQKKLF